MYAKVLVCLDNSDCALRAASLAVALASGCGARLSGLHVYAARLHNSRFREMEGSLPASYTPEAARNTREVHDTLITKGLRIISDAYSEVFIELARASGIDAVGVSREGKNFSEIVKESEEGGYGLVAMGRLGLGKTPASRMGSVAERCARRLKTDLLIAQDASWQGRGIAVGIDGSPESFGALRKAVELSRVLGGPVEAISAFDPVFHQAAFRSLAGVLSDEAGRLFRFSEQQRLHDEIIDKGLERIYRGYLDTASRIASSMGAGIKTALLSGKAPDQLISYCRRVAPSVLVVGRTGAHAADRLDIGSTAENCLREAPCHVLVTSGRFLPEGAGSEAGLEWTEEALAILGRIPQFAQAIVRNMVEDKARAAGLKGITAAFMREVRKGMEG